MRRGSSDGGFFLFANLFFSDREREPRIAISQGKVFFLTLRNKKKLFLRLAQRVCAATLMPIFGKRRCVLLCALWRSKMASIKTRFTASSFFLLFIFGSYVHPQNLLGLSAREKCRVKKQKVMFSVFLAEPKRMN